MQRFRDQLLARAALALDEHRGARRRHLRDQVEDTEHRLALAHDIGEAVTLAQRAFELDVLFFGAVAADRGTNVGEQFLVVPGFLDEVLRPAANRIDDVIHGAECGDHDDRQLRLALPYRAQNLNAVAPRQRQIQQHQIEGLLGDALETQLAVLHALDRIAFQRQKGLERLADRCLVVDDQNARE